MSARRVCTALAVAAALAATSACDSSTAKNRHSSTAGKGSATPVSAAPSGQAVAPATVAAKLKQGVATIRTAHVVVAIDADGTKIDVTGDEQLSGGKVRAVRASSSAIAGSGDVAIVVVGGKTYAKLPKSVNKTGKPYVLVTTTSKSATIRQLASSIDFALGSASIDQVAALADAAKSARIIGPATVDGVPTTRYAVTVVTAELPATFPGKTLLQTAGLDEIPADVYLDGAGRPVQISQAVKVQGHGISVKITASRYNQAVTITAPPANQVGTG